MTSDNSIYNLDNSRVDLSGVYWASFVVYLIYIRNINMCFNAYL